MHSTQFAMDSSSIGEASMMNDEEGHAILAAIVLRVNLISRWIGTL